jgi:hypothetical protein
MGLPSLLAATFQAVKSPLPPHLHHQLPKHVDIYLSQVIYNIRSRNVELTYPNYDHKMQNHGAYNNNVGAGLELENRQEGRRPDAPPGNIERITRFSLVSRITENLFGRDCLDRVLDRHHISGRYMTYNPYYWCRF